MISFILALSAEWVTPVTFDLGWLAVVRAVSNQTPTDSSHQSRHVNDTGFGAVWGNRFSPVLVRFNFFLQSSVRCFLPNWTHRYLVRSSWAWKFSFCSVIYPNFTTGSKQSHELDGFDMSAGHKYQRDPQSLKSGIFILEPSSSNGFEMKFLMFNSGIFHELWTELCGASFQVKISEPSARQMYVITFSTQTHSMWSNIRGCKAVYTITIQDERDRRLRAIRNAHNHRPHLSKGQQWFNRSGNR